ncbi:MAG: LysR family transcriptional regulator [Rhodobacteraceae bacterium]|nr:LysR family transcriptional regulator [Paracoccaceae bacterium]
MKRNLPPLNALKAFEATARHSSFSKAGEELRVTHTSVARHVRNLEDWLRAPLVHKSGRNISLTNLGKAYHAEVERIFTNLEHVTDRLVASVSKTVRLSVEPFFAHQWLAQKLAETPDATTNADFELSAELSADVIDLDNSDFDLAVRFVSNENQTKDMHIFSQETMYPYVSRSLVTEDDSPEEKLEALYALDLMYSYRKERWDQWFQAAGITPKSALKYYRQTDFRLGMLSVLTGKAAMIVTPSLVQEELRGGLLCRVSEVGIDTGGFALLVSKRAQTRPAVQHALAFLKPLLATYTVK